MDHSALQPATGSPGDGRDFEMMPDEPPPMVVRCLAALLIALFAAALFAASAVRIPETVRSPFILISETGADPIQAPLSGSIQTVNVREGAEVEAGAVLFLLRSDEIRSWQTQLRNCREDRKTSKERAAKLEEAFGKLLLIKTEEMAQVEQEVGFRTKHADFSRDYAGRMDDLFKNKLLSEVELLKARLDLAQSEKDLSVAQKSRQQAILDRQRLETERVRQRAEEEAEDRKLETRIDALVRQLENCEGDHWTVRAPYRAVVIAVARHNEGGVVQTGQPLCELSPVSGKPKARLALPEASLAQIGTNSPVRFFFDAFPYHRYGSVQGKLDWISPAAVDSTNGVRFTALASLGHDAIMVGDQLHPLRVGMKGEARITVGRRTLLEFAFEPLRGLREGLKP
jgi:membrane fusion protein, adhesin transport system